jgi:hypothetical protein
MQLPKDDLARPNSDDDTLLQLMSKLRKVMERAKSHPEIERIAQTPAPTPGFPLESGRM